MKKLIPGFNMLVDEQEGGGEIRGPIVMIKNGKDRMRSGINGYVHGDRVYLRSPLCETCENLTPAYELARHHLFKVDNWVVFITHNSDPELQSMLIEVDFTLLPIVGESMGQTIEFLMEYLTKMVSNRDEILVSRISDNVMTFTVKQENAPGEYIHFHLLRICNEEMSEQLHASYITDVADVCDLEQSYIVTDEEPGYCDCDEVLNALLPEGAIDKCARCHGCSACRCEECDEEDCEGCTGCGCEAYDDDCDDEDDEDDNYEADDVCPHCEGCTKDCYTESGTCRTCDKNTKK